MTVALPEPEPDPLKLLALDLMASGGQIGLLAPAILGHVEVRRRVNPKSCAGRHCSGKHRTVYRWTSPTLSRAGWRWYCPCGHAEWPR